jgi:uncharacterized membrane protein
MRHASVDILRAFAVMMMIVVHFVENLSGSTLSGWLPGGTAAPIFTLLTGVSFRLWLRAQEERGIGEATIVKRAVRRGLFFLGLGFVFNVFVWMPEDWDVLTLIGAATLFLTAARHLEPLVLAAIAAAAFFAHPFLRESADFSSYWTNGYFDPDMTLTDVLLGFGITGYFPFIPWIIYPIAGFLAADVVFPDAGASPGSKRWLAVLGGALAVSGLLGLKLRGYTSERIQTYLLQGWTMFPPSVEFVCWTLGFAILCLLIVHRCVDQTKWLGLDSRLIAYARPLSHHSLSIYLLHHVVHLWPLWVYGVATGHEATYYWRQSVAEMISVPLAFVFIILCYGLFRWLERHDYPTVERLMRWLCD